MDNRPRAILYMIAAAISFAMMGVFIKMASDLPVHEKVFFRNLISLFLAAIVILKTGHPFFGKLKNQPFLMARSIFGLLGVITFFYAIDNLLLVDADMLNKLSPFFVTIFAALFLGEKLNISKGLFLLVAFTGALLIIKPSFDLSMLPAISGTLSAICAGAAYTLLRYLKNREQPETIVFYFSLISVVGLFPFLFFGARWPTFYEWPLLLGIGVSAAMGQFGLTLAYKQAPASEVSIYIYTSILFSAIFGMLFFSEIPDMYSVIGGIMIIGAAVSSSWFANSKKI